MFAHHFKQIKILKFEIIDHVNFILKTLSKCVICMYFHLEKWNSRAKMPLRSCKNKPEDFC